MNLASIIESHPSESPALIDGDERLSYGALRDRVARARGSLVGDGVAVGDRVAIIGDNSIDMVVALFAVVGVGAVAVPLSPLNPVPVLHAEMHAVGACRVVVGANAPRLGGDVPVTDAASLANGAVSPLVERSADDLAVLLFTSGTAGAPKAAMLSHGNLLANQQQAQSASDPVTADDVVLGVLPIDHIFGLNVMVGITMAAGGSLVLVRRFHPAGCAALAAAERVTSLPGVPAMWAMFADDATIPADSFRSVRRAFSGAAPLPNELAQRIHHRFGLQLVEGYGLTEASPVVTTAVGQIPMPGSVGRVVPGVEARLVDDDGNDVLEGDPGELWVRGPNVFQGYWNDVEATKRVITDDGWLKTGDIATVDDAGRVYLVNRSKDLIIVAGFNVYPAEVEQVLGTHPSVLESAVVGVAHPTSGEAVKAYVVLRPGSVFDSSALIAHCRASLARYKCPADVVEVEELPKGAGGKVLRRLLR